MDKPVVPIEYAGNANLPAAPVGAKAIFRQWERRRPIYNIVLVVVSSLALPLAGASIRMPWFWMDVLAGAIFANVCFFAGPILESYLDWLGRRPRRLAVVLFVAGTVLASLLAVICIAVSNPMFAL